MITFHKLIMIIIIMYIVVLDVFNINIIIFTILNRDTINHSNVTTRLVHV